MVRLFHRWPPVPTRDRPDPPDEGGSGAPADRSAATAVGRAHSVRAPPPASQPTTAGQPGRPGRGRVPGRRGGPARAQPGGRGNRPSGRHRLPVDRRRDLPAGDRAGGEGRAAPGLRRRLDHRHHRTHPGPPQDGPPRPHRLRTASGRGDARRPGPRPPAGGRGRRPGHPGRRPLPGPPVRPVLPGRRGHLDPEPPPPAGTGPVAAHPDPRPGHRLGRHPAFRRDRAGGGARGTPPHHQRGPRAPPSRRAGRPARGPDAARAPAACSTR